MQSRELNKFVSAAARKKREADRKNEVSRKHGLVNLAAGQKQEYFAAQDRQKIFRQKQSRIAKWSALAIMIGLNLLALAYLFHSFTAKAKIEEKGFADLGDFTRAEGFVARAIQGKIPERELYLPEVERAQREDWALMMERLKDASVLDAMLDDCTDMVFLVPCRGEREGAVIRVVPRQGRWFIIGIKLERTAGQTMMGGMVP